MKLEIELDIPEGIIDKDTRRELLMTCKAEAILRLFAERKIPSVLAVRLLGLTRVEFMELTRQRGIPYIVSGSEDLERDLKAIEDYRKGHHLGAPGERSSE